MIPPRFNDSAPERGDVLFYRTCPGLLSQNPHRLDRFRQCELLFRKASHGPAAPNFSLQSHAPILDEQIAEYDAIAATQLSSNLFGKKVLRIAC
ncbi:MAG: hypothetical protein EWM72_00325 [Nitrospira sp.]|nr:MAG: hypothetical protein EWM72_00325 [Nitrospira sp.]